MEQRFLVFASCPADFWPLWAVVEALWRRPTVQVILAVLGRRKEGSFERPEFALSVPDGVIVEVIQAELHAHQDFIEQTQALGAITSGMGQLLLAWRPDVVVIMGDRYELLATLGPVTLYGAPIAHIGGGDVTSGAFDDAIRNAVSRLSAIHLCGSAESASRLIAMGVEPQAVHVTGEPALDRLSHLAQKHNFKDVERALSCRLEHPLGLLAYHPPTAIEQDWRHEVESLICACSCFRSVIVTHPNSEPGSRWLLARLQEWEREQHGVVISESLGKLFPAAMKGCDVMIGNSSAGIVEAPFLKVPSVNVGQRQEGRLRATSVIDAVGDEKAIRYAIDKALSSQFRRSLVDTISPFGDGQAGEQIAAILAEHCNLRTAGYKTLERQIGM